MHSGIRKAFKLVSAEEIGLLRDKNVNETYYKCKDERTKLWLVSRRKIASEHRK